MAGNSGDSYAGLSSNCPVKPHILFFIFHHFSIADPHINLDRADASAVQVAAENVGGYADSD